MTTVIKTDSVADLLSPREFHEAGGKKIGINNVYALCASGRLKSVRVGKKYLIPKSELTDFLRRETGSAE